MRRWRDTEALIIDEGEALKGSPLTSVSMIDGRILDRLDELGRRIRRSSAPFGGLQVSCSVQCDINSGDCVWRFFSTSTRVEERRQCQIVCIRKSGLVACIQGRQHIRVEAGLSAGRPIICPHPWSIAPWHLIKSRHDDIVRPTSDAAGCNPPVRLMLCTALIVQLLYTCRGRPPQRSATGDTTRSYFYLRSGRRWWGD